MLFKQNEINSVEVEDENKFNKIYSELKEKCSSNRNDLLKDLDSVINDYISGMIANYKIYNSVREDLITVIERLFIIRKEIIDINSNQSSSNN